MVHVVESFEFHIFGYIPFDENINEFPAREEKMRREVDTEPTRVL